MGILIEASSVPYESVRFTTSAKLIPADQASVERQKALARYRSCQSRSHTGMDLGYVSQIHKAFSKNTAANIETTNQGSNFSNTSLTHGTGSATGQPQTSSTAVSSSGKETVSYVSTGSGSTESPAPQYNAENSVSYSVQRGAFEMRVARGDLLYVPALEMTIVTQYPGVHFEYTGGFNYVPPLDDSDERSVNITI